jgi:hypothetical protein
LGTFVRLADLKSREDVNANRVAAIMIDWALWC